MTFRIAEFMTKAPQSIEPSQTLPQALERMNQYDCTHLPVVSEKRILGILSQRDINFMRSFKDLDFDNIPVMDVMTEEPFTVTKDARLYEVATAMINSRISSALIESDNGELEGIFTTTDALKAIQKLSDRNN